MVLNPRYSSYTIWPRFFPTSTIVVRKTYFKKFLKLILPNKFPNLEIDARISIYSHLKNEFAFIKQSYTVYIKTLGALPQITKYGKCGLKEWCLTTCNIFQKYSRSNSKRTRLYLTKFINFFLELKQEIITP